MVIDPEQDPGVGTCMQCLHYGVDGKGYVITFSGIIKFGYRVVQPNELITFKIPYPSELAKIEAPRPDHSFRYQRFRLKKSVAHVAVAGITNDGSPLNSIWSVESFGIEPNDFYHNFNTKTPFNLTTKISFSSANIKISDLSYTLTVFGELGWSDPLRPPQT
jgi:hypothetical protein